MIQNTQKITDLTLKLCSLLGFKAVPVETVLAEEPQAPEVAEVSEEDKLKAEIEQLKAELESVNAELEAAKAELETLKGEKSATESENTQLKEKLSAVENAPADPKINLSAQAPAELSPAQKHFAVLRAMEK